MIAAGKATYEESAGRIRRWGLWAIAGMVLIGLMSGCGALENEGSPGANQPPEVFLVNVPPDGYISASSLVVQWYGTDVDGRIVRFDYTVVRATELDSVAATLPNPGGKEPVEVFIDNILDDDFPYWISVFADSVSKPTEDVVKLFASTEIADCDSVEVQGQNYPINCISRVEPQYFFIRAIDDVDSTSTIKYRTFQRTNHWPDTYISESFDQIAEYLSLPKLTQTYRGIQITWGGEDRLDFVPPAIPDLEYHWRIYGPYPRKPTLADTLDEFGAPRTPIWESKNPDTLVGVWVKDTTVRVWDLWHTADKDPNEDTSVTRQGYFAIVVTARDDAFVADETPALGTFTAIYPRFERDVILIEDTWYSIDSYGNPAISPNNPSQRTNQDFMARMLATAYPNYDPLKDLWWRSRAIAPGEPCRATPPPFGTNCMNALPLRLLASHRLVIFIDDDVVNQIPNPDLVPPIQAIMRRYLDVGGNLWIISRHGLIRDTESGQSSPARLIDFMNGPQSQRNLLGHQYFDIEAMYYPGWRRQAIPIQIGTEPARSPAATNDEFIGARVAPEVVGLPAYLPIDSARVANQFFPEFLRQQTLGDAIVRGVVDVNFLVRGSESTPLYLFDSWRPAGPIPPENGPSFSHNKIVMQRFVGPNRDTPLYKTAYTTFPLYFIQEDVSLELVRGMVDWFMLPFELTP